MTDITELAQSLKAAAIDAKELAIIARYSKGRAAAEKFYALANPNNVIALVEALEKVQQRIAELEHYAEADALPVNIAEIIDSGDLETICWQHEHYKAEDYRLALYRFRTDREEAEK
ncbi:TPA: ead/Ea22-like family protein [Klebsiella oxytoca]